MDQRVYCDPANAIIKKLGGINAVAEITGAHFTWVTRWRLPKDQTGTGGTIPQKHVAALLAHAKAKAIDLSLEEFFPAAENAA